MRDMLGCASDGSAGPEKAPQGHRRWTIAGLAVVFAVAVGAVVVLPGARAASLPPSGPFGESVRSADALLTGEAEDGVFHHNRAIGLSFRHPATWQAEDRVGAFRKTVIRGPEGGGLLAGVALVLHPSGPLAADSVLDLLMLELSGVVGARQVSRTDGTLGNGTPARRLLYTFGELPGQQGVGLLLAAVEGERAAVVNVMGTLGKVLDEEGEVERFLASVRLEPHPDGWPEPQGWGWTVYSSSTTGLGSDFVTGVAEDSQGRMWFSSWGGGVSMFDGEAWTRFGRRGFGPPDHRAMTIMVDSQDRVWVGTDTAGVAIFDGETWETHDTRTGALAHERVRAIYEDSRGNVWVGTWGGGVSAFDGETWQTHTVESGGLDDDRVRAIVEDGEGRMWFGTWGGGIGLLDPSDDLAEDERWAAYTRTNSGLASNRIGALMRAGEGAIWVGTYGGGLSRFDGADWTTWTSANGGVSDDFILSIVENDNGRLGLGTRSRGVIAFNPDVGEVAFDEPLSGLAEGLEAPQVQSLLYDSEGRVWAASYGGGVFMWDGREITVHTQETTGLLDDRVEDLVVDPDGRLWLAIPGSGVAVLNGGTWRTYTTENSELPSNEVVRLHVDREGRVWAGVWGEGMVFFDGRDWVHPADRIPGSPFITAVAEDGNGQIWAAALEGFFLERSVLTAFDGESWVVHETVPGFLASSAMPDLTVDQNGWVWVATLDRGVRVYDGAGWLEYNTENSALPSDRVLSIAEDGQGRIWAGTFEGLSVFDGEVWTTYTAQDTLVLQDLVLAITPVAGGVLLSTVSTGAVYFDGDVWLTFNRGNSGLEVNRVNAAFADAEGNLWFATAGGGVSRYGGPAVVLDLVPDEVRKWAARPGLQPRGGPAY